MGKGDVKTAKGKRVRGSYGITRKRSSSKKNKASVKPDASTTQEPKVTAKKVVKKATESVTKKPATAPKKAAPKKTKGEE